MSYNFEVRAITTLYGYVEADSKEEAMQRIKDMNVDYMDINDENLGDMDMSSVKLTKTED
jgi:hypothetical protein|nr:MAG TPA: Protein of unknown function (DUF1381) [Caudoviricetes sp.]